MDTNVLLFRLHHPDALAAHFVDHPKDVYVVLTLFARRKQKITFLWLNNFRQLTAIFLTCICWINLSNAMKVPDRPTPALQWTTMGL